MKEYNDNSLIKSGTNEEILINLSEQQAEIICNMLFNEFGIETCIGITDNYDYENCPNMAIPNYDSLKGGI